MVSAEKRKATQRELVYLVRGQSSGKPVWHYVLVDKLKQPLFEQMLKTGQLDVAQYGRVLYSGWSEHPPQDIMQAIERDYKSQ